MKREIVILGGSAALLYWWCRRRGHQENEAPPTPEDHPGLGRADPSWDLNDGCAGAKRTTTK
ncbi:hypothetical protein C0J52_06546 [Blattella germanica]|nr:hypothetical protein C0J52_06546 [Blattella germanica]